MKQLRKRFIFFNVLVISCIMLAFAILAGLSERSTLPANRIVIAAIISLGLVWAGSWFLSKAAIAPIKAAWQKQLDFTADASHELRTPLSSIQTNLDVVLSNPAATVESQIKWLKNIEAENKRMRALVSGLLLISRSDTDEKIASMACFDLSTLVTETVTTYDAVAKRKNISLTASINGGIFICGDKDKIRQLVVILLDNAIQYTDSGGKITIALFSSKNKTYFEILDTGIGITPDEIDKIFNRFYRSKKSRQKNPDGSGLGLAIANVIAKEHDGVISVKSQLEKGSVFTLSLPLNMKNGPPMD